MALHLSADELVATLRNIFVMLVRQDERDLSARQLSILLTCYLHDGPHTVRGLAADLDVKKPAISRALDRLAELDLIVRKVDPRDRRSVLVERTIRGAIFLTKMRAITVEAAKDAQVATPDYGAREAAD